MVENTDHSPATPEGLARWKSKFKVNHVLMAVTASEAEKLLPKKLSFFPSKKLIAPEMVVSVPGPIPNISDAQIEAVLPN